ncbi:MAG: MotA/TolQ/ExbB proton channel family protein [Spirochaetes bacterium]|nr:MotA/TolQ/ExbB proton channel family protein [Spirochaetota bacterium]
MRPFAACGLRRAFGIGVLAVLWALAPSLGAESESQELERLTREAEAAEKNYWQLKEKQLRERAQVSEQIQALEESLKGQYLKKNNLLEESYLIAENINSLGENFDQKKIAWGTFQNRLAELVRLEEKKTRSFYPYLISPSILRTGQLGKFVEAGDLGRAIDAWVDYRIWLLDEGETFELAERRILLSDQKISVQVPVLRLGFVHASFVGEKSAGYLVRMSGLSGIFYDWNQRLPEGLHPRLAEPIHALQSGAKPGKLTGVLVDPVQAGNRIKALARDDAGGFWTKFLVWFKDGGLTMYPLIIVLLFGLALSGERILLFWRLRGGGVGQVEEAVKRHLAGHREEAWALLQGKRYPLMRIVQPLFEQTGLTRPIAERLLEEKMVQELPILESRIPTLAVLATIAPLLGLLGTVAGMITLFETINIYGAANPKILAGGISEALVATETGLAVAIPMSLIHHVLTRVKTGMLTDIEKATVRVLNELFPGES